MWQPENGKYGRTRDGQKAGPMVVPPNSGRWTDVVAAEAKIGGINHGWYASGYYYEGETDRLDLIAEWTDEPDLTAITTPFGLLDEATQAALKAHGGPYEMYTRDGWELVGDPLWGGSCVYRVKPGSPATPQLEPLADRLQRIITDGMAASGNEGATALAVLDAWAAERGVTIKEG